MKKIISILIISIAFASCSNEPTEYDDVNSTLDGGAMVRIRGCEYIKSHVYMGWTYTHCGDCNNMVHRIKQQ